MKEPPKKKSGGMKKSHENVQIFVAEDDPALNALAAMLLEQAGWSFRTFNSGEEALDAFLKADPKPSLVISDFSMGMHTLNGVQFLKEIKRLAPSTKAFLVSGTVEHDSIPADGQPVDYFMPKPYNTEAFLEIVRQLLSASAPASSPPPRRRA